MRACCEMLIGMCVFIGIMYKVNGMFVTVSMCV